MVGCCADGRVDPCRKRLNCLIGRAEQSHSWHCSKAGKSVDSSMQAKHEAIIQPGPASRRVTINVVVSEGISIVAYP